MSAEEHQMFYFWSFIVLTVISGYTAYYANKKGRNPYVWFIVALLIGVFAPLVLLALPSISDENETKVGDRTMSVSNPDESLKERCLTPPPPPELNVKEDHLWFYLNNVHQQIGPLSIFALRDLWNTGRLETSTYVWCEGMDQWARIEDLPLLREALNKRL